MKRKKIFFRPIDKKTQESFSSPIPASSMIPQWYKDIPKYIDFENNKTVKTCAPFLDSISSGYLIKLSTDLFCKKNKEGVYTISWKTAPVDPIGVHATQQIGNYPIPPGYTNQIFKFNGDWGIETPKGYSLLYMHPLGRFDLPFYSFHGIVDADKHFIPMNIPFVLKNNFEGCIKSGTPISQVIPIKREKWSGSIRDNEEFNPQKVIDLINLSFEKWYKDNIWETKDYK